MKHNYIFISLLFLSAAAQAQYTTEGKGETFTFRTLSETAGAGVSSLGDNAWLLSADLTVSEGDKLQILDGDVIKIADGVTVTVNGDALFNPASGASILPADADARPAGFVLYGNTTMTNLKVQGGGFMYCGATPLTVENCDFSDINSISSVYGVIVLAGSSYGNRIVGCTFTDCEPGAINTPANMGVELLIENCTITNVSTENAMRPFINITVCADKEVIVRNNTLVGARLERPGGIGISNMLNTPGANKVTVENNSVKDCSWGLNLVGGMEVRIVGNVITDNCWDPDDDGGIAATLYSLASLPMSVYAEGNTFKGNKWGPVVMGGTVANFGKIGDVNAADYNPGNNVFKDNGHIDKDGNEILADICNFTTGTVYAQNCIWNNATTPEEAAKTILDNNYSSQYGPVIYDPVNTAVGVGNIKMDNGMMLSGIIEVYDYAGNKVYSGDAATIPSSVRGMHVVRNGDKTVKMVIK